VLLPVNCYFMIRDYLCGGAVGAVGAGGCGGAVGAGGCGGAVNAAGFAFFWLLLLLLQCTIL